MKNRSIPVGRPSVLRHTNAHGILKLLRECGSCSRADLVRASGLSAPTVTNVVKDLIAANLVEPLGEGESSGGRPPDMIRFKAERGCLLAVEITATQIS
ncbi:MAG: winged helix-turn-helix domain-containing protein, partial [Acidobacteriaceae bacterium]